MASSAAPRVPIPRRGVDYRGKVVLAPMVRSGECPSRLLALHYGADLVWGPETIDRALIGTTRRFNQSTNTVDFTRLPSNLLRNQAADHHPPAERLRESVVYRLHPEREGRRLIYQLGTADPDTAVAAAKLVAADVAGIDVNAGCPKPFSTSGGMGAALLKTPDRLCSILEALVRDVGRPHEIGISVKIRILDTADATRALVQRLVRTGITGLTVHCRTTPMRPREAAIRDQLRMVADTCREAGVACLMNGDVASREDALRLVAEYGVDGAMIATAAETNPSVFRPIADGGPAPWPEVVSLYIRAAIDVDNRLGNTKYLLGQMIPGKQPAYKAMQSAKSYTDLVRALHRVDTTKVDGHEPLADMALELDRRLLLGAFEPPKLSKAERKKLNKAAATAAAAAAAGPAEDNADKSTPTEQWETDPITASTLGRKRNADAAGLDLSSDRVGDVAPGTLTEQASTLVV